VIEALKLLVDDLLDADADADAGADTDTPDAEPVFRRRTRSLGLAVSGDVDRTRVRPALRKLGWSDVRSANSRSRRPACP